MFRDVALSWLDTLKSLYALFGFFTVSNYIITLYYIYEWKNIIEQFAPFLCH